MGDNVYWSRRDEISGSRYQRDGWSHHSHPGVIASHILSCLLPYGSSIVELGCGSGLILEEISKVDRKLDIIGSDIYRSDLLPSSIRFVKSSDSGSSIIADSAYSYAVSYYCQDHAGLFRHIKNLFSISRSSKIYIGDVIIDDLISQVPACELLRLADYKRDPGFRLDEMFFVNKKFIESLCVAEGMVVSWVMQPVIWNYYKYPVWKVDMVVDRKEITSP